MTTNKTKPSHRVYAVTKRGEKSVWTEIGACWTHGDNKGFSLKLNFVPPSEAELVIREPKDENAAAVADPSLASEVAA